MTTYKYSIVYIYIYIYICIIVYKRPFNCIYTTFLNKLLNISSTATKLQSSALKIAEKIAEIQPQEIPVTNNYKSFTEFTQRAAQLKLPEE